MAISVIHVDESDTLRAYILNAAHSRHAWIALRASADINVYLPCGPSSAVLARVIAAELLKAADALEAIQLEPVIDIEHIQREDDRQAREAKP